MKEKKNKMKMSLWTFAVIATAFVIIIGAIVIAWINIDKKNKQTENVYNDMREYQGIVIQEPIKDANILKK